DKHGTVWKISMLPLGGYVKFFGDAGPASNPDPDLVDGEASDEAKPVTTQFPNSSEKERLAQTLTEEERAVCFHFKPLWAKAAVVAAGPIANFLLAIVIFTMLFWVYGDRELKPVITDLLENGPAAEAGFLVGDVIIGLDGRPISTFNQLVDKVTLSTGDELTITVDRNGDNVDLKVTPQRMPKEDALGNTNMVGMIGITSGANDHKLLKFGPGGAVIHSVKEIKRMLTLTVKFIGRLIIGKEDPKQLSGPISIAKYAGQASMIGFSDNVAEDTPFKDRLIMSLVTFISIAGSISVSIGFLNLLPIPILDGGHLLFYGIEAISGRPVPQSVQMIGFKIGIVMLGALMIFVFYNDIAKLLVNTG
ncbi:MAG: RIP metalloprotease RseP, partial [Parvularculaceae bacterium]